MVGNQLIDPDPGGQPSSHSNYNRHKINIIDKYFFTHICRIILQTICTHSLNRNICHIFLASIATYQQQTQDQHNFLRNICSIFSQTYLENILRQKKKKYHPTFTNKDKRLTHIKNT